MEIVVVENLYKKFCKQLHLSLWYGFLDLFFWSSKCYLRKNEEWALQNISFKINRGEIVGILGKNGSGKTTLVRVITGIYQKDYGKIQIVDKVLPIFVGNLALNRFYTGLENYYFIGSSLGYSKKILKENLHKVKEFSELDKELHEPMGTYSSGMRIRLRFGIIYALRPKFIMIDEALSVSDVNFQNKCIEFLKEYATDNAILLISHDMSLIEALSNRIILLHKGEIIKDTHDVQDAIKNYAS